MPIDSASRRFRFNDSDMTKNHLSVYFNI